MMDEAPIRDRIEELVEEEHRLWRARAAGRLEEADHRRMEELRSELDRCWDLLRRRQAGSPAVPGADIPEPPNDLEGPEPEPPHLEHGVHTDEPAPDPGVNPNVP